MEKNSSYSPKPYLRKDDLMLELMSECPAFSDRETAGLRKRALKDELEIKIRVIPFNGHFLLYRVLVNKNSIKK